MSNIKIVFKIILLIYVAQICKGQKTFTISGQVISEITQKPYRDSELMKIGIKGDSSKTVFLTKDGFFKISNLLKGQYKLFIPQQDEVGNYLYIWKDTLISIDEKNIHFKWVLDCSYCECEERGINKDNALIDIKKGSPKLFFVGGISGKNFSDPKYQKFAEKYGLQLFDFGCLPVDNQCIEAYTSVVFGYLDKKFGKEWRNEIPKDALGID